MFPSLAEHEVRSAELEERLDLAGRLLARRAEPGHDMVDFSPRLQRGEQ